METSKLISKLIPPNDYEHRNGFSNKQFIDELTDEERQQVEIILMEMLLEKEDMLIVESLGYMRVEKSIPLLLIILDKTDDPMKKIIIASSIFEISKIVEMINICIASFNLLTNTFQKISAFYYLKKFNNKPTNSLINKYVEDPDYLVSYNAKRALGI